MSGIGIVLLIIGVLIIFYNIIIQFANLSKIISYTFATNSLGSYWEYYFKSNFSLRALISSLIGLIIAIVIFFIIAPFVLYRKFVLKNDVESQLKSGLMMDYEETYAHVDSGTLFQTNIDFLNLKDINVSTTGMLKLDLMSIIAEITKKCEELNKKVDFDFMKKVTLSTKQTATIPVMMTLNGREYPLYLLYTPQHKENYEKVKKLLFQSGFRDTVHFSVALDTVRMS